MHKNTKEIKQILNSFKSYDDKIDFLRDSYKNSTVILLASGPSLGHVDEDLLKQKLDGNLVFSVKQAYLNYKRETDFHFLNDCNLPIINGYPGYMYGAKRGPISIASSGYPEETAKTRFGQYPQQHWDIFCRVIDPLVYPNDNMGRLCENHEFEKGLFTNTLERPCGPSITIETVIYMAVHVGAKNIYAIGWDSGNKTGEHFYNDKTHLDSNRTFEYEMVQNGSGPLYNWLQEKEIQLSLISETSALSDEIPRIKLEEV